MMRGRAANSIRNLQRQVLRRRLMTGGVCSVLFMSVVASGAMLGGTNSKPAEMPQQEPLPCDAHYHKSQPFWLYT